MLCQISRPDQNRKQIEDLSPRFQPFAGKLCWKKNRCQQTQSEYDQKQTAHLWFWVFLFRFLSWKLEIKITQSLNPWQTQKNIYTRWKSSRDIFWGMTKNDSLWKGYISDLPTFGDKQKVTLIHLVEICSFGPSCFGSCRVLQRRNGEFESPKIYECITPKQWEVPLRHS